MLQIHPDTLHRLGLLPELIGLVPRQHPGHRSQALPFLLEGLLAESPHRLQITKIIAHLLRKVQLRRPDRSWQQQGHRLHLRHVETSEC